METNKGKGLLGLFLYGGSRDERNQGLYDRAGYYSGILLFIGMLIDIFIKGSILKTGIQGFYSELAILVLDAVFVIFLYIRFGISIFQNPRQMKILRGSFFVFGIALVSILGYAALWLELPGARTVLDIGPIAWALPVVVGLVAVSAIWLCVRFVDCLASMKDRNLEDPK
jgi:hypothetical protein